MLVHVDPFEVVLQKPVGPTDSVIHASMPPGLCAGVDFQAGEYFYATLEGLAGTERVRVDACAGGRMFVVRTDGKSFEAGECVTVHVTVADVKEIFEQCLAESGSGDGTTNGDTNPVNCVDVTSLPDSALLYFVDPDKCDQCQRISFGSLKAQLGG